MINKLKFITSGYTGNGYYCADINECDMLNGGCSTNPLVQCINTPVSLYFNYLHSLILNIIRVLDCAVHVLRVILETAIAVHIKEVCAPSIMVDVIQVHHVNQILVRLTKFFIYLCIFQLACLHRYQLNVRSMYMP